MARKLSKKKIERLAVELRGFLMDHDMWIDTRIYFNGRAFSTDDGMGHHYYNDPNHLIVLEDEDPKQYTEYAGGILTMTFEGDLYELLNYPESFGGDYGYELENKFLAIFEKYGLYYEMGESWNLTACEM